MTLQFRMQMPCWWVPTVLQYQESCHTLYLLPIKALALCYLRPHRHEHRKLSWHIVLHRSALEACTAALLRLRSDEQSWKSPIWQHQSRVEDPVKATIRPGIAGCTDDLQMRCDKQRRTKDQWWQLHSHPGSRCPMICQHLSASSLRVIKMRRYNSPYG